jgi:hypothetical protein
MGQINLTKHAIQRFKERVADIPESEIKKVLGKFLRKDIRTVNRWSRWKTPGAVTQVCPIYNGAYDGIDFLIPVMMDAQNGKLNRNRRLVPTIIRAAGAFTGWEARRAPLPFHPPPQITVDREKFTALWESGMTTAKIAEKIGCSQESVSRIAARLNLRRRRAPKTDIPAIAKAIIIQGIYSGDGFRKIYADRLFNFPPDRRKVYQVFYLRMKRLYDSSLLEFSKKARKISEASQKERVTKPLMPKKEHFRRMGNVENGKEEQTCVVL